MATERPTMKCISLWQPWATLWVLGVKIHETRHWPTNVRGTVGVHAAKKRDREAMDMCCEEPFAEVLEAGGYGQFDDLPFGAIVGTVEIVACLPTHRLYPLTLAMPPNDFYFGNFEPGRWAWKAENPVLFKEPIPWKGSQGFFDVPTMEVFRPIPHEENNA